MQFGATNCVVGEHSVVPAFDLGNVPADSARGCEVPRRIEGTTDQQLSACVSSHCFDGVSQMESYYSDRYLGQMVALLSMDASRARTVPSKNYCRKSSFMFSFVPHCPWRRAVTKNGWWQVMQSCVE